MTSVGSLKFVTESSGSYVESKGSSTFMLELVPEGPSSSSSSSKRDLLFGLFSGGVVNNDDDDNSGTDWPTPVSGYNIVVCVPVAY